MQSKRKSEVRFQSNHFKKIGNIDVREMSADVLNNPSVFSENFMTYHNFNLSFLPNLKKPIGWPLEKDRGNQDIGIKNTFHLFFLTLLIALPISDNFSPARRACFRASLSKSSN